MHCITDIIIIFILVTNTYFNASELTFPRACTAASLMSTVSQRRSGTTNLYNPEGDTLPPGDLLSLRSVVRLSGEELQNKNHTSYYNTNSTLTNKCTSHLGYKTRDKSKC